MKKKENDNNSRHSSSNNSEHEEDTIMAAVSITYCTKDLILEPFAYVMLENVTIGLAAEFLFLGPDRLVGLVVKGPSRERKIQGFDFSEVESYQ